MSTDTGLELGPRSLDASIGEFTKEHALLHSGIY